ncbi:hypothetical protein HPB49_000308 [Dermacentor silvarum]|uniref:Uncharacterized protein n=1 Tax=Dermacentor silvarum TaxID=543639 RepID=A0ACB8CUH2_DERSI|nr:hypothetical protein HPB49_000308 [Dermacentor silvarum]
MGAERSKQAILVHSADALRFGTSSLYIVATTSVLAALLATLLRRHLAKDRSRRAPPGPVGWPVLGKLNFSSTRIPFEQSVQWSKKYGPIVGLKQGSVDVVMLNDNEQIKEILSRPELQDRPTTWSLSSAQKGFSIFSGQQWKENRDFSMRALAKLGLGSETMRQHIQFEARHLADTLASKHGHPVSSFVYMHRSHINSICRFLLGYRYDLDDAHFASLQEALSGFRLQRAAAPIEHRADWLRRVLIESLWPTSISAKRRHDMSSLNSVVRELVQKNEDTKNSGRAESYIDLYMEKIREAEKHNKNNYFTGRRSCPGENMAMVEIFLFLTTLLHQFRILPENEKPIIITPFGPSPELRDTKLRFILRKHS